MALPFILFKEFFETLNSIFLSEWVHSIIVSCKVELLLIVVHTYWNLFIKEFFAVPEREEDKSSRNSKRDPVDNEIKVSTVILEVHKVELTHRKSN